MNTTELFGIQFALRNRYKAQVTADFNRWKSEKQWFLAEERNKRKLFERILRKYTAEHSNDYRSPEDIASELWENLKVAVARTNWQQVFEEVLGSDYEFPNYMGRPYISRHHIKELLFEYNCRHYCFTDSALQECEKVHITEPLDMEWLQESADGKRQLNFGDQFIRYEKRGNRIIALAASFTRRQEQKYLQHTFFILNLKKHKSPKRRYDPIADLIKEKSEKELEDYAEAFENKSRELLYKMVTFLDLIPLKQITLPAGKYLPMDCSSNQANQVDPVSNNEDIPITVVTVTANWNSSLFIEETKVRGYWREFFCGKGSSKIERRFVKPHFRKGHERAAQKLKSTGT